VLFKAHGDHVVQCSSTITRHARLTLSLSPSLSLSLPHTHTRTPVLLEAYRDNMVQCSSAITRHACLTEFDPLLYVSHELYKDRCVELDNVGGVVGTEGREVPAERERERERVCVCVCVRERESERECVSE
jgi:hypothetical protein